MVCRTGGRRGILSCVTLVLVCLVLFTAFSEVLMPATGKKTKKNGSMVIDFSNQESGYVMVKASNKKKLKLRVKMGDNLTLDYDLRNDGQFEVIPLQYGSGKYNFTLYSNVSGKKYAEAGKMTLSVTMEDENSCFLYPNQYVNYDEKTSSVVEAESLCKGKTDARDIYDTVCNFMRTSFTYDYIKAATIKSGIMPDIEGAWKKHMGICQDLSAIMVSMLRSQGVPAKLMIGTLGTSTYHAWVSVIINGEEISFDPTAAISGVDGNQTYTLERFY